MTQWGSGGKSNYLKLFLWLKKWYSFDFSGFIWLIDWFFFLQESHTHTNTHTLMLETFWCKYIRIFFKNCIPQCSSLQPILMFTIVYYSYIISLHPFIKLQSNAINCLNIQATCHKVIWILLKPMASALLGLDMVRTWRARCVDIPGGPIQTVCLTFSTPLLPISPRSPRWYRKRSSHIVLRCRQIAYNNH